MRQAASTVGSANGVAVRTPVLARMAVTGGFAVGVVAVATSADTAVTLRNVHIARTVGAPNQTARCGAHTATVRTA